jgi:hypothetical protein
LIIRFGIILSWTLLFAACSKKDGDTTIPPPNFTVVSTSIDNEQNNTSNYNNTSATPKIRVAFNSPVKPSALTNAIELKEGNGTAVPIITSTENKDSILLVQSVAPLASFTTYTLTITNRLQSIHNGTLASPFVITIRTGLNNKDKFPRITDNALLDMVQKQTFRYFWDFAHPVSGHARERNTSGDIVTSGGSGFGIMAIVTGISRNFITRAEGLARMQKIVSFLSSKAQTFKGAFPHWLNGVSGAVVPFSAKDNGADLVETAYLMQGLLTARQYFDGADPAETSLRNDINSLWKAVQWNWFRKGSENVLYWHWSPSNNWEMNLPVRGWNEALITYVLAASSPDYAIPKVVYDDGWSGNGTMQNGRSYYGIRLPLGPNQGGPLFFAHYSFLGLNPKALKDQYADYWEQNTAHTLINYNYCKANPKGWAGYSDSCWGLTASDNQNGYAAHEPVNDLGVITPSAALSSFPYTPTESMKALHFYYYKLGDKLWGEYGFKDAFNLSIPWFADSYLAIDQGPIIVMIENHRSGLLWDLFMSCPEVKVGLRNLGFTSPHL